MEWQQDIFIKNIEWIVDNHCDGNQSRFNMIAGRDAVTRWKGGVVPRLEILIKVADTFHVTMDWLITGKEGDADGIRRYDRLTLGSHDELEFVLHSTEGEILMMRRSLNEAMARLTKEVKMQEAIRALTEKVKKLEEAEQQKSNGEPARAASGSPETLPQNQAKT